MTGFHLHLVSDSTGGTLDSVARACLAQFPGQAAERHFWSLVRTPEQLRTALEGISKNPGLTLYTLIDDKLAAALERRCAEIGCRAVPLLTPVLEAMGGYFGRKMLAEPGVQHRLDADYFARMDAVDYALHHDDGQLAARDLDGADVVLVGVSRTSKTPTCIYLAGRGVKAANIPLVPGVPLPPKVLEMKRPLFVGLTAAPERLVEIRRARLAQMGETRETEYLDLEKVKEEVLDARRLCGRMGWPVIDVTRRSVEETAAEILMLLERRRAGDAP